MTTPCEDCPLRKLDGFLPMSPEEVRFMAHFKVGELKVEPNAPILMEGSNAPQLYTVLHGMGVRYKLTEDGERQVINFVLPGDFLGLQAGMMDVMGHSVEATTVMTLCVFDRKRIWEVFRDRPERGFDLTWLAAIEEHFLGETLTTLGQRDAEASVAWALMRFAQRGEALGILTDSEMAFPFRQRDLADALGLSLVHTNKILKRLRDRRLARWSDGRLFVEDMAGLVKLAGVSGAPRRRPLL